MTKKRSKKQIKHRSKILFKRKKARRSTKRSLARKKMTKLYVVTTFIILILFSIYGYTADYVPSSSWVYISFVFAAISSLIFSIAIIITVEKNEILRRAEPLYRRIFAYMAIPVFSTAFIWVAVAHGGPALVANVVGSSQQIIDVAEKRRDVDRYGDISYFIKSTLTDNAFPASYCISEEDFYNLPNSFVVKFIGKETAAGFFIKKARLIDKNIYRYQIGQVCD